MRFIDATRAELDYQLFKNRAAVESDCPTLVSDSVTVRLGGKPVLAYFSGLSDPRLDAISAALPKVNYSRGERVGGLVTMAKLFGYAPRHEMRSLPCRSPSLASEQPDIHEVIASGASVAADFYAAAFPETAAAHLDLARQRVKPEYRLGETMFTSGIANSNNPLRYHFDAGNFRDVCSVMLGFRRDTTGGHLCVPELGIRFEIGDRSVIVFDGQGLLHGVTPIFRHSVDARRFTVVYYSLRQMWNCEAFSDEVSRMRAARTRQERARAKKGRGA